MCVCVSLETDHLGVAKIISRETAFKMKQFEATVTANMINCKMLAHMAAYIPHCRHVDFANQDSLRR